MLSSNRFTVSFFVGTNGKSLGVFILLSGGTGFGDGSCEGTVIFVGFCLTFSFFALAFIDSIASSSDMSSTSRWLSVYPDTTIVLIGGLVFLPVFYR